MGARTSWSGVEIRFTIVTLWYSYMVILRDNVMLTRSLSLFKLFWQIISIAAERRSYSKVPHSTWVQCLPVSAKYSGASLATIVTWFVSCRAHVGYSRTTCVSPSSTYVNSIAEWDVIPQQEIEEFIMFMRRCYVAIGDAHGGYFRYWVRM